MEITGKAVDVDHAPTLDAFTKLAEIMRIFEYTNNNYKTAPVRRLLGLGTQMEKWTFLVCSLLQKIRLEAKCKRKIAYDPNQPGSTFSMSKIQ